MSTGVKRSMVGTVISNRMQKTIVVQIDRTFAHPTYKKYIVRYSKVKAHDEKNDAKMGDKVMIVESRPLSKEKRWSLAAIVRRSKHSASPAVDEVVAV